MLCEALAWNLFTGEPLRPNALYAHPGLGNVARWAQRMPTECQSDVGCHIMISHAYHVMSCANIKHLFLNYPEFPSISMTCTPLDDNTWWFWSQGWCQCPDPRLLLKTSLGISAWPGTGTHVAEECWRANRVFTTKNMTLISICGEILYCESTDSILLSLLNLPTHMQNDSPLVCYVPNTHDHLLIFRLYMFHTSYWRAYHMMQSQK